ncbi:hypothetical protein [Streptacidiphilus sp. MAP12-16]|uniref:hypothetical protein n=1 Tax=Streptacidiphilus sp. MAP12-16 TaxID=3156300 RepID=UPI0035166FDD
MVDQLVAARATGRRTALLDAVQAQEPNVLARVLLAHQPTRCTDSWHVCEWSEHAGQLEQIFAGHAAGAGIEILAQQQGVTAYMVSRIIRAHQAPYAGCGTHDCEWADKPDLVRAVLGGRARGETLAQLSAGHQRSLRQIRRILAAHGAAGREGARLVPPEAVHGLCSYHTCHWAGEAAVVEGMLDSYDRGWTTRRLGEHHARSKESISLILDAHSVVRRSMPLQSAVACEPGEVELLERIWLEVVDTERGNMGLATMGPEESQGCSTEVCGPRHRCFWARQANLVNELCAAYKAGWSVRRLAERYPFHRSTVGRILDAHGVQRRSMSEQCTRVAVDLQAVDVRNRVHGEPLTALAAECGLSRQALSNRLARYRAQLQGAAA